MKYFWVISGIIAFVVVGLIGYSHATRNQRRHDAGTAPAQLYTMYCARCHGENGEPVETGILDLKKSVLGLDEFVSVIKIGRNKMPAFKKTFTDDEFEPLYRHVKSLKP